MIFEFLNRFRLLILMLNLTLLGLQEEMQQKINT